MSQNPSTILSDALAAFTKQATLALSSAEDAARTQVTRANSELRESRRERDEAVKVMHQAQLEQREWKDEFTRCKTSMDKAEVTYAEQIKYHMDSLVAARREADGWREQFTRLEETSRMEVQDWKDRVVRLEEERIALSARIDDLVSEKLARAAVYVDPYASRSRIADYYDPIPPVVKKRASTSHPISAPTHTVLAPYPESAGASQGRPAPPISPHKPIAIRNGRSGREMNSRRNEEGHAVGHAVSGGESDAFAEASPRKRKAVAPAQPAIPPKSRTRPSSRPREHVDAPVAGPSRAVSTVLRRVSAVISVPVKKEEDDDAAALAEEPASGSEGESEDPVVPPRRSRRKKQAIVDDEDYGSEGPDDAPSDDDELMIGAEDNRKELHQAYRVVVGAEHKTPPNNGRSGGPKSVSSSKKRPVGSESVPSKPSRRR